MAPSGASLKGTEVSSLMRDGLLHERGNDAHDSRVCGGPAAKPVSGIARSYRASGKEVGLQASVRFGFSLISDDSGDRLGSVKAISTHPMDCNPKSVVAVTIEPAFPEASGHHSSVFCHGSAYSGPIAFAG
jgi:hypothetical protein